MVGHSPEVGKPQQLVLDCGQVFSFNPGDSLKLELVQNHGGSHTLGHFRIDATADADAVRGPFVFPPAKHIAEILAVSEEKREPAQKAKLWEEFKKTAPELEGLRNKLAAARKTKTDFEAKIPRCIVSIADEKPRTVRILPRGNFLVGNR